MPSCLEVHVLPPVGFTKRSLVRSEGRNKASNGVTANPGPPYRAPTKEIQNKSYYHYLRSSSALPTQFLSMRGSYVLRALVMLPFRVGVSAASDVNSRRRVRVRAGEGTEGQSGALRRIQPKCRPTTQGREKYKRTLVPLLSLVRKGGPKGWSYSTNQGIPCKCKTVGTY